MSRLWKNRKFIYQEDIKKFSSNIQIGCLAINDIIHYGICLHGKTKTTLTSTGHLLSGNSVKGIKKKNVENMIQNNSQQNSKAKIGNTYHSQTLIPNFFDVKLKSITDAKSRVCVVDTSGYENTFGVLNILAAGYFHYRLYSKIQNMKFILCFQQNDSPEEFLSTIKQFTSYFNGYDNQEIRQEIWNSCAFLITKVNQTKTIYSSLREKLINIVQYLKQKYSRGEEDDSIKFIEFIEVQNRFNYIKNINQGDQYQNKQLLQQINSRITSWYTRSHSDNKLNEIDMSQISFNLGKQIYLSINKQQRCKKQYQQLIAYFNKKQHQFQYDDQNQKHYGSLNSVIQQLVNDAMGPINSHNFLNKMKSFVDKHYNQYDASYSQQRQKKQKQLASMHERKHLQSEYFQSKNKNKNNYFVKKFQCLANIQKIKRYLCSQYKDIIAWLQKVEKATYDIIQQLSKLCFLTDQINAIINKYRYIVYNFFQEAKLFTNLFQLGCTQQLKSKLQDQGRLILQYLLISKILGHNDYHYKFQIKSAAQLKNIFIEENLQNELMKNQTINYQCIIVFFSINQKSNPSHIKIFGLLILKYSDQFVKQLNKNQKTQSIKNQKKIQTLRQIYDVIIKIEDLLKMLEKIKGQLIMLIRKLVNNLGKILQSMKRYQTAKKVYESIWFVESVSRIFKKQLALEPNFVILQMDYFIYLSSHRRQNYEILEPQHEFQMVQEYDQLEKVTSQILENISLRDKKDKSQYEISLSQKVYFKKFSAQLQKQIIGL